MFFLSRSQSALHQWRQDHLADDLWACWEALLMKFVNTPSGAAFWDERSYIFGNEFGAEVRPLMARQLHPKAKAFGVVPVTQRAAGSTQPP